SANSSVRILSAISLFLPSNKPSSTPKAGSVRLAIRGFTRPILCNWKFAGPIRTVNRKLRLQWRGNPGPEKGRWWCIVKADSEKTEKKKVEKAEANLPVGTKIQREIIAWFWVGLAFLLINGTIGQARVIPSGSMERTLLIGDHLIMSRIGYDAGVPFTNWHVPLWRNPKRQQIIIFKPPFAPDTPDYVKRVIGLPGETVDIRDGAVWINGRKLVENYTTGLTEPAPPGQPLPYHEVKFPYHVPENCYFAMGDNRGNSLDS